MTDEVEEARSFKLSMRKMEKELDKMQSDLYKSVPFFSTRYKVCRIVFWLRRILAVYENNK